MGEFPQPRQVALSVFGLAQSQPGTTVFVSKVPLQATGNRHQVHLESPPQLDGGIPLWVEVRRAANAEWRLDTNFGDYVVRRVSTGTQAIGQFDPSASKAHAGRPPVSHVSPEVVLGETPGFSAIQAMELVAQGQGQTLQAFLADALLRQATFTQADQQVNLNRIPPALEARRENWTFTFCIHGELLAQSVVRETDALGRQDYKVGPVSRTPQDCDGNSLDDRPVPLGRILTEMQGNGYTATRINLELRPYQQIANPIFASDFTPAVRRFGSDGEPYPPLHEYVLTVRATKPTQDGELQLDANVATDRWAEAAVALELVF